MRLVLYISLIFITQSVFCQDIEMLGFINKYRKQSGKKELSLSKDLTVISVEQTKKIIKDDSLSHSHKTSEIATMGKNLPSTVDSKLDFCVFVESVMGIKYEEPKTDEDVIKIVKLYCLYMFDKSPKHKSILLGDYKNVGFEIITNNIKYKSNDVTINGKVVTFKNIKNHYLVDFYCVVNFD